MSRREKKITVRAPSGQRTIRAIQGGLIQITLPADQESGGTKVTFAEDGTITILIKPSDRTPREVTIHPGGSLTYHRPDFLSYAIIKTDHSISVELTTIEGIIGKHKRRSASIGGEGTITADLQGMDFIAIEPEGKQVIITAGDEPPVKRTKVYPEIKENW